ncbi:uncharacterized protein LOC106513197 isoform X2 [Austrofundulus limnaeus]|uniref:Uncharacterized protein LOC106513197 isoform X2 n=1 Tax=Austrofundulus limnaeus TaxID=52670 RepID=A0A2I4APF4_AUSLI|nr:PREDICTED: uncharacterized protein LOC106513197 isoform X2 [Austrofundulus limnaeus]
MNSPGEQELTPSSRKRRLMAAAVPGEDSPLLRNASRADRNGLGGLVHCFICGSGVTPGKELKLQVTYKKERFPFFPFLQNQEPAPGACDLSPDGHALVCAVCHCFLTEQWNSFERSRTPIEKRMYWLKRPYQCDSRRVPQEWNISYDLERRISVSSQNYDGGAESDFSSFSENENISDQEMDLVDRAGAGKEKYLRTPGKSPRDSSRKNNVMSIKNSPDSQRAVRYTVGVYDAQGLPKAESVQPARRGAKIMNNVCQSAASLVKSQERIPQRGYDNPPSDTPVQDNGVIMRNRRWLEEENVRHVEPRQIQRVADSSCAPSRHPALLHRGRAEDDSMSSVGAAAVISKCNLAVPRENNYDNSDEDEINITSDDDRGAYGRKAGPITQLRPVRDLSGRKSAQAHHTANSSPEECVCYICGTVLRQDGYFKVSVQKQERAQGEPFFPFLWLHSAPRGAVPISPSGTTVVCSSCHTSLMQQWQSFQLADVPVLQRLYVVPINQDASAPHLNQHTTQDEKTPSSTECIPEPRVSHEACYLCGKESKADMRVVYAQAGVGKSRTVMYFPFINMLPCPPNAQRVRNGRVHCCPQCHSILEDIWAAYRLSISEDLITSVSSFLVRYHASMSVDGSGPAHSRAGVSSVPSSSVSVCYLCGAELSAGGEHQLHVNPPGRCGEREPFYPFLTVHPPAPGAKPVDTTGLVSACKLCYHDLHAQWAQHESKGVDPSTSASSTLSSANLQPPSSPWARQYSCEAFVCFFCRQEQRRQGRLCAVTVARLPIFLYAPRSPRTLLVDDGRRLVIGSCAECKALVQVGQSMQQDGGTLGRGTSHGEKKDPESDSPQSRHKVGAVIASTTGATKGVNSGSGASEPAHDRTPSCSGTSETEKAEHQLSTWIKLPEKI